MDHAMAYLGNGIAILGDGGVMFSAPQIMVLPGLTWE